VWLKKKEIHLSPLQYDLLAVLVAQRLPRGQPKAAHKRSLGVKRETLHPLSSLRISPPAPPQNEAVLSGRGRLKRNRCGL